MALNFNILFKFLFSISIMQVHAYNVSYHFCEVTAYNTLERNMLYKIFANDFSIAFLNGITNDAAKPIKIVVKDEGLELFETMMNKIGIQYVFVDPKPLNLSNIEINDITNSFYNWNDIMSWINVNVPKAKFMKTIVIAKTYERRDVVMIKVSMGQNKPAVFIVGGESGMDWISSAIILNFIHKMIFKTDEMIQLLLNFDFYVIPLLNPDGFVYSKKKDRLWKKNRNKYSTDKHCNNKKLAIGVSLDRNWFIEDYHTSGQGKCNADYRGPKPISEEETQGLSYVLNNVALKMLAFINLRGYGNCITIPYGYTKQNSNNHDIVMAILKSTSKKVKEQFNVSYFADKTRNVFYNFSGNVADWVKLNLNTPIVFTIHLDYEDSFLYYPQHIAPLSNEFQSIINDSLILSNQFYGPLFSGSIKLKIAKFINYIIILQQLNY